MLDRLKTVFGAVDERALLSVLSHICIHDGRIQAANGRIAIDAPFPEFAAISATVPAERFLAAIAASDADPKVEAREGRIVVASGPFKARLPCLPVEQFPRSIPDPPDWELEDPLLPTMKRLRAFMADDATNIWSTSLLITQKLAVATNNVCLLAEPCSMLEGTGISEIAIPGWALDEIIRMGSECTSFGVSENSATFYFDTTWIKTQLITAPWPSAKVSELYSDVPKKLPKSPEGFARAVAKVIPFCKDEKFPVIILNADGVSTEDFEHAAEVTGIKLPDLRFNGKMLTKVVEVADHFGGGDSKAYFAVGPAKGIIVGLRV